MRILSVVMLAVAVAACDGAAVVTPGPTPTALATPTASPPATTPSPATSTPPSTPGAGGSPGPSAIDLLPLLTSQITVVNLADQPLTLTVTLLDPDSADEFEVGTFDLQPLQVTTQSVIPARLRIAFAFGGSSAATSTCTIDVADGEELQFAAIATGVAITATGQEPANAADLNVSTAARCRAGAAQ
jgi:hypothetical protein